MSSQAGGCDLAQRLGALPASGSCEPGASGLPAPRSSVLVSSSSLRRTGWIGTH